MVEVTQPFLQRPKALSHPGVFICSFGPFAKAYSICGQHAVSFFLNSSAQHRENEAEPESNGNKNFRSGPNVPCQSAQTDKSVSSA